MPAEPDSIHIYIYKDTCINVYIHTYTHPCSKEKGYLHVHVDLAYDCDLYIHSHLPLSKLGPEMDTCAYPPLLHPSTHLPSELNPISPIIPQCC